MDLSGQFAFGSLSQPNPLLSHHVARLVPATGLRRPARMATRLIGTSVVFLTGLGSSMYASGSHSWIRR